MDDEEILREIGRDILEDLGYTVYLAEDGVDALEVYDRHRGDISLVILDVIMPRMGGREAFIKLQEESPGLKVLFCSGFHGEGTEEELYKIGACSFIQKPYNRIDLSRVVAEAIGES
ncbi:MAG: response regulator [Desulfuromonadaceae bacterium]|nr:response regulator [Desulfuromonadaceae bacterium]